MVSSHWSCRNYLVLYTSSTSTSSVAISLSAGIYSCCPWIYCVLGGTIHCSTSLASTCTMACLKDSTIYCSCFCGVNHDIRGRFCRKFPGKSTCSIVGSHPKRTYWNATGGKPWTISMGMESRCNRRRTHRVLVEQRK